MLVSLITVNYNQVAATCALLDSIRRQDYRAVELIVVDNGSRENPERVFATRYPEVKFIRSERNLGFAGGNNLGLSAATGDYYFFVNNDAELTNGCISRLVSLFQKQPQLGMASPLICYHPGRKRPVDFIQYAGMTPMYPFTGRNRTLGQGEPNLGQFSEARPTAYAHGAAMMVPRTVVERVGTMEPGFFLYYEELDWGERIRRAGFDIWVEPRARVYHRESLTVQPLGALKTYYLTRNRVWFMRRNFRGPGLWAFYVFLWTVTVPKHVLAYARRRQWENLRAFRRGILWNFGVKKNRWEQLREPASLSSKAPNDQILNLI